MAVCCDLEVDVNGEETLKKRGGARVSSTDFCSFPLATIVITIFARLCSSRSLSKKANEADLVEQWNDSSDATLAARTCWRD